MIFKKSFVKLFDMKNSKKCGGFFLKNSSNQMGQIMELADIPFLFLFIIAISGPPITIIMEEKLVKNNFLKKGKSTSAQWLQLLLHK